MAKITNQRPAYSGENFKGLAAAILRDTGMDIQQLQQIAMHCPELPGITNTEAMVSNVNWFRVELGVSMEEWVGLVCSCKPLLLERKSGLQKRMEEFTAVGLDRAGVKACWMQAPDLLKLRIGVLAARVTLLQVSHVT